ncbi:phosphopantetheine-binding protein [Streptomyces sp. XM4193]|uniref:acyl carrier protein n=1 Tax=Streptomyces sp. XM4193 TaxID=2929782 RepID=UPI001FF8E095|nr:phosphopantetheine-binding protein [Streptomyces sp. XM4193]MCK1794583.1 phosphopantetheine-binding protein [Streptomyces sp. XM4193]
MFETLKDILVNKLKVSPDTITAEATPEEIDLDSLAIVELSLVLEKELGLTVSEDELSEAETVGDIVRLMDERSARV